MKNADPQDVVIVLGVFVLIISIIVFLHWAAVWGIKCQSERLSTRTLRLAAKQLVVKWAIQNATRTGKRYENIRYSR